MKYTCYKGNSNRISPLDPEWEVDLDISPKVKSNLEFPLIVDDIIITFQSGNMYANSISRSTELWRIRFVKSIFEGFIVDNFLFATDHQDLFVIDWQNGQSIKHYKDLFPNLLSAVATSNKVIWLFFENGQSGLCYFDLRTLEVERVIGLSGLATYLLCSNTHLITNENPQIIKGFSIKTEKLDWTLNIFNEPKNDQNFLNDFPFIIGDYFYFTQFPDNLTCIDTKSGGIKWSIKVETGINSFVANYYNQSNIILISGAHLFKIDYLTGFIERTYHLDSIKGISPGGYQMSYINDSHGLFYSYKETNLLLINFEKEIVIQKLEIKAGLKVPPIINANKVILMDKEGNVYF